MEEKLEQTLTDKYPKLYKDKDKPATVSLMCFGFECGDGWFELIYELSKKITEIDPNCEAVQIKEKFGGLRFYVGASSKEVLNLIHDYEDKSYYICMKCGSTENVIQYKMGWVIITLCSNCIIKVKKIRGE